MTRSKVLTAIAVASLLSGCDYYDAKFTSMSDKLTALDARVAALEKAPPPLPSIPTILWVQNPNAYPRASATYASKAECAAMAQLWGFQDDKGAKQVGFDPWITQSSKKDLLIVSCLPVGVTPYAK